MDRCPPDDVLLDHAQGRLSGAEAGATSTHLADCPACRSALSGLEALLEEAGRRRPTPGRSADEAVCRAIRRVGPVLARRRRPAVPPRRLALAAALLVAATGLVGLGARGLKAGAVVATVASAEGSVVVRRAGVDRPAVAGMDLLAGDRVAVPSEASAILDLPDASRAELGPDSSLTFRGPDGGSPLELEGGFLAVDASRRPAGHPLTIRTPDARAEVIGTRFTIGADAEETHLRVAEGLVHLVRVGDGASVDVAGGNRAEVADDRGALRSRPSLPGTALIIASHDKAPADFARFDRMVGDRLLGRRLRHLGFRVETRAHADVTAADLVGRPLVIVSYSEEGVGFEASLERIGLKGSGVPVLCFEPAVFPTLAMTGKARGRDFDWEGGGTGVEFPRPEHPLSGGLSGTRRDLFHGPGCFGWARPGPRAVTIAAVEGDGSRAVLFAYEAGAEMVGARAPGRRVGLFLDPSRVGEDSEPAWSLVQAAVEWSVEAPRPGDRSGGAR